MVLLTLAGSRLSREQAAWLGTAVAFASFLAAVAGRSSCWATTARSAHRSTRSTRGPRRPASRSRLAIQVDQLSVTEMLIVSGVGALIVLYSIGYMHGDPKQRRFFAYLDLFLFSMLLLVMAANFVLLLAGWGLVGPLLLPADRVLARAAGAGDAAKKAFVMNAIGDVGIAIAIFFMVRDLGTTDFTPVLRTPHQHVGQGLDRRQPGGAGAAGGGGRQVGPDPAAHLASRRHGRPHPGVSADPRRHHGDGRRVPGRAHPRALRERAPRAGRWWPDRRRDAADGGRDRAWCRPTSSASSPTRP